MAKANPTIGTTSCLNAKCGATIPVKENEGGTLNLSCAYCDLSAYAKAGTQAERAARAAMKPLPGGEVAAAPVVADVKPAAAPKKSGLPWATK